MLNFPTFISPCRVFWIACQRSGTRTFLPKDMSFCQSHAQHQSSQPFAGEPFFYTADRRRASGSGAGFAVTSSGPEGTPRDLPITEMSPDIISLVQRSVDQAATQAFRARRQVDAGANAFLNFHVAPLLASELRIPCSVTVSR